ncbi:AraC family transcriptional regulator [Paenibacillaceae bacterium]|nr:AraC family transcriptional regulator [Paenibacillaceae bacterium]
MTYFPNYLKDYPNMDTSSPLHISLNTLFNGYPAHRHDFLELSYVVEGTGSEVINGVKHPMLPGTLTFLLPYQIHEIITSPGSKLVLYNCMFSMDLLVKHTLDRDHWVMEMLDNNDAYPPFLQLQGREAERMRERLVEMIKEYKDNRPGRDALLKSILTEVLVRFDRGRREHKLTDTEAAARLNFNSKSWAIIRYIQTHFQDEDLMLSALAEHFSLSASRISEIVKETTGQTFLNFLHDLRIRHAGSLLASTEMSVIEIASEVGFGSYKTFSRVFRERKKVIPTEYRRNLQQLK